MVTRYPRGALAGVLALAAWLALPAFAQSVSTLRVRLHPDAAADGTFPDSVRIRLERETGAKLAQTGTTRTGALELSLAPARDAAEIEALLATLRSDRAVLWAETPDRLPDANLRLRPKDASTASYGRKFMLRLRDDSADIAPLLSRLGSSIGMPLAIERRIGSVWVLTTLQSQSLDALQSAADSLQADAAVRYADPVHRMTAQRVPTDPLYGQQWGLSDPVGGIDAPAGWNLQTGSSSVVVAVVDTGILAHPELAGRVLPGYNFISDPSSARNKDGRDSDASDHGDWTDSGDCFPDSPAEPSSWHGTAVSGLIAANANNGVGVAGVDWNAKILPVRALGRCGGTDDDIFAALLWAAGLAVDGVPPNRTPAKVVNMSLGGPFGCGPAIQDAVDQVMAQGTIVVVAAGNDTSYASGFTPASCSGVITVGATSLAGDRASYSNFGPRVDITAPGGDFDQDPKDLSTQILHLTNLGTTSPSDSYGYSSDVGTSAAAPLVTGTVSLMLARNALLTPGRVLSILAGTARSYPAGTQCAGRQTCGAGILDAGLALASTPPGLASAPDGAVPVVEYYRADRDHYFVTADPAEIAYVDSTLSGTFQRTGFYFYAYLDPSLAPSSVNSVCRFYASGLIQSHYYTADPGECAYVITHLSATWNLETLSAFYVPVPDSNGNCPDNTLPVYRFFDNRVDANHRYTTDLSVRQAMLNRGWVSEGEGPRGVVFCSPI